jgi:hypothetical protein
LLNREKAGYGPLASANLLRGKTVPESVVKEILERGELVTPETCGWHYVERLRLDDDYRLALFGDKAGLDHNGGLLAEGGHFVLFVDGTFLRTEEGGKTRPAFSGYRPQFYYEGEDWDAEHT